MIISEEGTLSATEIEVRNTLTHYVMGKKLKLVDLRKVLECIRNQHKVLLKNYYRAEKLEKLLVESYEIMKNQHGHHASSEICEDDDCLGCSLYKQNLETLTNLKG